MLTTFSWSVGAGAGGDAWAATCCAGSFRFMDSATAVSFRHELTGVEPHRREVGHHEDDRSYS